MKKLNKLAVLIATATLAVSASSAFAATATNEDNWKSGDGTLIWRTGDGALCWRDAFWTPATANPDCDGALQPVVAPTVTPTEPQRPTNPEPRYERVSYSADTFFDFDKSVLKPAGKEALDELVRLMQGMDLEVVVAIGHTDSTGPAAYNMKLSVWRAEAVKAYLVSRGVPADLIYIEGRGEEDPIATNATREGRALNRRVEIEIVGTALVQR